MAPKLKERRGKGIAVNVLALYSIDPNSNPAQVYRFYVKVLLEKNWKKKRGQNLPNFYMAKNGYPSKTFC